MATGERGPGRQEPDQAGFEYENRAGRLEWERRPSTTLLEARSAPPPGAALGMEEARVSPEADSHWPNERR